MSDLRTTLERGLGGATPPPDGLERMLRRRDRKRRNQRITAGAVGIAVFVAAIMVATGGALDRSQEGSLPAGVGNGPTATLPLESVGPPVRQGIVGLPTPGAEPSRPIHGELVLHLGSGSSWTDLWVYDDGRAIWSEEGTLPPGSPPHFREGATGFVEQRLTPAGVDFLRSRVISTGLFEHDVALLRGPADPPFLEIQVRNGDRLVWLTWAVKENWRVTKDSPSATPEQASALSEIEALLSDPASWPTGAWETQEPQTFVPSTYEVWLRVWDPSTPGHDLPVGDRELALLPTRAREIFLGGTKVDRAARELTTDDVRALARAMNAAGLQPWNMGESALRYQLDYPNGSGNTLSVFFGPVLPHGEAVFLGSG